MMNEAPGMLFTTVGGANYFAEDFVDNPGSYELRGDKTWEVSFLPIPGRKHGEQGIAVIVTRLNQTAHGHMRMKLFKSSLASESKLHDQSVVYKSIIQKRSGLEVAGPEGVPRVPAREQ